MGRMSNFESMKRWIEDNGGFIGSINLHKGIYGISYESSKEISEDEVLVRIPKKLWIDEKHKSVKDMKVSSGVKTLLALWFEISKGEKSFYYPYIMMLPEYRDFEEHPLVLARFDIKSKIMKEWQQMSEYFYEKVHLLIISYQRLLDKIRSLNISMTTFDLKYLYLLYLTRTWGAFVPGADFFSHRETKSKRAVTDIKGDNFEIISGDTYQPGCEVFINYGNKDNIELLSQYGFITDNYKIPIKLELSTQPIYKQRAISQIHQILNQHLYLTQDGPNLELALTLYILFSDDFQHQIYDMSLKPYEANKLNGEIKNLKSLTNTSAGIKQLINNPAKWRNNIDILNFCILAAQNYIGDKSNISKNISNISRNNVSQLLLKNINSEIYIANNILNRKT